MTMKDNFEPGERLVDVHVLIDLNGYRMTVCCYPFITVTATFRCYNFSQSQSQSSRRRSLFRVERRDALLQLDVVDVLPLLEDDAAAAVANLQLNLVWQQRCRIRTGCRAAVFREVEGQDHLQLVHSVAGTAKIAPAEKEYKTRSMYEALTICINS